MKRQRGRLSEDALFVVLGIVIGTFLAGTMATLVYWSKRVSCKAQWQDSGYQYRYELFAGCRVSADGKVFIPADNLRELTP